MNGSPLPQSTKVRYLGLHIDKRLTWNAHITIKRQTLDARRKQLFSLLGRRSKLPLGLKLKIYKTLLAPVWMYASQLFGSAKPSVLAKIQRFQSKFLRLITDAPLQVSNRTLHDDLKVPYITDVIRQVYGRFKDKLRDHDNVLIRDLNIPDLPGNTRRRLHRRWSRDILR
jgi:hypothetical protein